MGAEPTDRGLVRTGRKPARSGPVPGHTHGRTVAFICIDKSPKIGRTSERKTLDTQEGWGLVVGSWGQLKFAAHEISVLPSPLAPTMQSSMGAGAGSALGADGLTPPTAAVSGGRDIVRSGKEAASSPPS